MRENKEKTPLFPAWVAKLGVVEEKRGKDNMEDSFLFLPDFYLICIKQKLLFKTNRMI